MRKVSDKNRLSIIRKDLIEEWDYEKNGDLKPENVSFGSHKKVNWLCKNDHKWEAPVFKRSNGEMCPFCCGRRVSDKNRLTTNFPEICKEWDYNKNVCVSPENFSYGSEMKVWWVCENNHSYKSKISSRVKQKHSCPYCYNRIVCKDNCLLHANPELVKEWDFNKNKNIHPKDFIANSNVSVWWVCKFGHSWKQKIISRNKGYGCPYCYGKKVSTDKCLATRNPKLANEWHKNKNGKLKPSDVLCGSNKKVWWKCGNGHEWQAIVSCRSIRLHGCPICNKIILKEGEILSSMPEAYFYLTNLKGKYKKIEFYKRYGIGKSVCDFYIPKINTYYEITGYNKKSMTSKKQNKFWVTYYKNILKKKKYVTNKLKARFKFIQIEMTPTKKQYVKENYK
jgi:hypothetical protein